MVIDYHTHIFNDEIKDNREKYFFDHNFKFLYSDKNAKIINAKDLILGMKNNDIISSVVMGFSWMNLELCEHHNKYLLESAKENPEKIVPFAGLPARDNYDLEKYIMKIKKAGFKGIGELSFYLSGLTDKVERYLVKIFKIAAKYNLPVCLHLNEPIGHYYSGKYPPSFNKIYNIINQCPDAKVILAHWGGGIFFYELMPEVKELFKNVYYDTAASSFLYDTKIFKIALDIIGSEKILFGSDFPLLKPERYFSDLKSEYNQNFEAFFRKNSFL